MSGLGSGSRAVGAEPVLRSQRERRGVRLAHAPAHRGDGVGARPRRFR
jgi:hypothetical protein